MSKRLLKVASALIVLSLLLTSCGLFDKGPSPTDYVIQSRTVGGLTEDAFAPKAIPPQQVKLANVSAGRTWTTTIVGEGTCTLYDYADGLAVGNTPLEDGTQFTEFSENQSISCDTSGTYVRFDTRYDSTTPSVLQVTATPSE